jgi:hypothetical protein
MPEEIAGLTKVVGKEGRPLRTYHGTSSVFDKFDLTRAEPYSGTGKGIWTSESPELASHFVGKSAWDNPALAEAQGRLTTARVAGDPRAAAAAQSELLDKFGLRPNVRMQYLDARNPLDLGSPATEELSKRLASAKKELDPSQLLEHAGRMAEGERPTVDHLLQALEAQGHAPQDVVRRAGFDALTQGRDPLIPHLAGRVHMVFDPSQVYSPFLAPRARYAGRSPLLAALGATGGEQALTRGQ